MFLRTVVIIALSQLKTQQIYIDLFQIFFHFRKLVKLPYLFYIFHSFYIFYAIAFLLISTKLATLHQFDMLYTQKFHIYSIFILYLGLQKYNIKYLRESCSTLLIYNRIGKSI